MFLLAETNHDSEGLVLFGMTFYWVAEGPHLTMIGRNSEG